MRKTVDILDNTCYNKNVMINKERREGMTREQLVKKAVAIAEERFDKEKFETFKRAIESDLCVNSDIEQFIKSWESGDGYGANLFATMVYEF